MKVLRAAWIAPMDAPPIANGAVAFADGRIIAAGIWDAVRDAAGAADIEDLGNAVILPGLVNPHTHLELSHCTAPPAPASFVDWVLDVISKTQGADETDVDSIFARATALGADECLQSGVTCVGDISQRCDVTRPMLRGGPLRVVSFGEALGTGRNRPKFAERLARAADRRFESPALSVGVSPHAPYSVDQRDFAAAIELTNQQNLPLATHLSELPFEGDFLRDKAGPLRELLDRIGTWSDDIETFPGSPIKFAEGIGLLESPSLLAHVNYCDDEELALLARGRASVVYCPRTHRYFGHPPHRWREMLSAGVNVAVGTDSRASSPDLNLVEEIRLLRAIAADLPALTLWQMVTSRAAKALRQDRRLGTLTPGKVADFAIFDCRATSSPLEAVLQAPKLRQVIINGLPIAGDTRINYASP